MEVHGFDWDEGNREKCQTHGLELEEIESVFINKPYIRVNSNHLTEEERFHAVGITKEGRHAFIVFTIRTVQAGKLIRPISARPMHQKEIDHYEKQSKT